MFLTCTWPREPGQQHSSFFLVKHPPAFPAHPAFIWHCPFYYNILNDIEDHSTSSRNRNRGNRSNIKSRQGGPSRLRLCFLQSYLRLTEWLFLRASVRTLLNFHCLRVQISWGILPQRLSYRISRVHFRGQPHTLPQVTPMQISSG